MCVETSVNGRNSKELYYGLNCILDRLTSLYEHYKCVHMDWITDLHKFIDPVGFNYLDRAR